MPLLFDGSIPWAEYWLHFQAVGLWNGWDYDQAGLQLLIALRGQALTVASNISFQNRNIGNVKEALGQGPWHDISVLLAWRISRKDSKRGWQKIMLLITLKLHKSLLLQYIDCIIRRSDCKEQWIIIRA
ncbi:Retrotransposon protein [Nesidiocoris tenuis]|uniref:Retrotransposon protein n=1 Tax=Nesidiocoris tenuis TaxID=355587 RepID=A0ABN7AT58_9HEMI|nr:Retrotransposon protein [Nesidiocoris tenuis]